MAEMRKVELVRGPQDGAFVHAMEPIPEVVYVGPKNLGDGFAAWGREGCKRFPCKYAIDGYRYAFMQQDEYEN